MQSPMIPLNSKIWLMLELFKLHEHIDKEQLILNL